MNHRRPKTIIKSIPCRHKYLFYTIKNISLNLSPRVAQFVESIICLISQRTVLNRCNNIDKYIVLKRDTTKISLLELYHSEANFDAGLHKLSTLGLTRTILKFAILNELDYMKHGTYRLSQSFSQLIAEFGKGNFNLGPSFKGELNLCPMLITFNRCSPYLQN